MSHFRSGRSTCAYARRGWTSTRAGCRGSVVSCSSTTRARGLDMADISTVTLRDVAVAALADCLGRNDAEQPELNVITQARERLDDVRWTEALARLRAEPPTADASLWK